MFYRARQSLNRAWFNANIKQVLNTPALPPANTDTTVASMLCHRDLIVYLLAIKSFVRHLDFVPQTVVLNDGSLTPEDLALLRRHIPAFRAIDIHDIDRGRCPKGGAWERLLMLTALIKDSYAIQLDSDTLTQGDISEVNECAKGGRNFELLGDRSYPSVEPMLAACERSKTNLHPHVQAYVERNFDQLPEAKDLKYLRGNAGFVGLKKNAFDRERVEWFSETLRRLAGDKWNEWGSEQVTTSLLIANSDNPLPLPAAKYLSYWAHPEIAYTKASFLHFIGPKRWHAGLYRRTARSVVAQLEVDKV